MTDLYPHEWLWRWVKEHSDFFAIVLVVTVAVLTIGCVTMWVPLTMVPTMVPTTDMCQVQTMNQPSAFSYAPIILCAAFAVLGIGIYSHYYGEEEE
jgi:hypothetical protein